MTVSVAWRRLLATAASPASRARTIFALGTGHGKAGMAVVRCSGDAARDALLALTGRMRLPQPRQLTVARFASPLQRDDEIDRGLVAWFPAPRSFTGEDTVEFHVHGGTAVIRGILEALAAVPGCRPADPGEFTRRAFANDKLDLLQVDGLADLINAQTDGQRRQALRQMEGTASATINEWVAALIKCRAQCEAWIDFAEDQNIEDDILVTTFDRVRELCTVIERHLARARGGELLRDGIRVTIFGPPNAGKSSLLNALARRPASIVSPIAGTTRDVVEVVLSLGDYAVILSDTAGIRERPADVVEEEGIRRARDRMQAAAVRLCVLDAADPLSWPAVAKDIDEKTIVVLNKSDISTVAETPSVSTGRLLRISCATGSGVPDLEDALRATLRDLVEEGESKEGFVATQARHRHHMQECVDHLQRFLSIGEEDMVLGAEELRQAARALQRITGQSDYERMLDEIFSSFCIGK